VHGTFTVFRIRNVSSTWNHIARGIGNEIDGLFEGLRSATHDAAVHPADSEDLG
jgi:hypothetical protein